MKSILALFVLAPILSFAQRPVDSSQYYQKQMAALLKQAYDSTMKSDGYISLKNSAEAYLAKSHNYFGTSLFIDVVHSDYSRLNDSITKQGFPKLNSLSFRIGFGVSGKTGRTMLDFSFFAAGFNNKSQKGDEKITSSLSNLFQFDLGYDLLNSRFVSLYPFVGISARLSSLSYATTAQTNGNYSSIANIVSNNPSANGSSTRVGYDVGMGIDFLIAENKKKTAGKYLFIKGGTNRPIWADSYKIENVKYKPDIKQADWLLSIGIKFASRK